MIRTRTILIATLAGAMLAGSANAGQVLVSQKDKQFDPEEISAASGDTVKIVNDDEVAHNVIVGSADGGSKNSGVQKPGEHMDFTVEKAGDYTIRCGIHPKMKMVVHAR